MTSTRQAFGRCMLRGAIAIAGATVLSGVAAAEVPRMTLQMAHNYAPNNIWYDVGQRFVENVEAQTDGRITFNVAHSASTGTWAEQIEALQIGTNDIVIQSVGTLDRYAPLPGIEAFPYLIRDTDHFKQVYYGPVGRELYDAIEVETGFRIIGAGYRGARVLSSNRRLESLADVRGLALRVPPLRMYTRTWELLGASPTPMPFTEVFTSLQQGVIDGQENPYEIIESFKLDEVQDYVIETNHVIGAMTFIFDSRRFASFTPEVQRIITEAAEEAMLWSTAQMLEKEDSYRDILTERGMEIIEIDLTEFRAQVAPIRDEFPELSEWVTRIAEVE